MAFTSFMEQTVLKLFFGGVAYTPQTTYSVGLSYTDPTTSITEPTGGSYARKTINNDSSEWNAPVVDSTNGGYKVTNKLQITFPQATADWSNGANTNLAYYFIVDSSANLVSSGSLGTAKPVKNGDSPYIDAGQLSITLV